IWSGLFCRSLGIRLPQLKVRGSVMRTGPLPGAPEVSATGPGFGYRKRADGGYIVSQPSATIVDIVPDSFRYLGDFLPMLKSEWRGLRLSLGGRFLTEARLPRRWALDRPSPFEAMRIADAEPSRPVLDESARNIAAV